MYDKWKLVDLLKEVSPTFNIYYIADHLTANGVVIQKQAEWILVDKKKGTGVCSNCNRLDHIDSLATHCRYCGAKMKEVV